MKHFNTKISRLSVINVYLIQILVCASSSKVNRFVHGSEIFRLHVLHFPHD